MSDEVDPHEQRKSARHIITFYSKGGTVRHEFQCGRGCPVTDHRSKGYDKLRRWIRNGYSFCCPTCGAARKVDMLEQ